MQGLRIALDGQLLLTLAAEGRNVLAVQVQGDRVGPEFASISATGGCYGEGENDHHLIWLNDLQIAPGAEVEIAFMKDAVTSRRGKTIDELYPGRANQLGPWQSVDDIFQALASEPRGQGAIFVSSRKAAG